MMELQDHIDVIRSVYGFDDESTQVGEAFTAVLGRITELEAERERLKDLLTQNYKFIEMRTDEADALRAENERLRDANAKFFNWFNEAEQAAGKHQRESIANARRAEAAEKERDELSAHNEMISALVERTVFEVDELRAENAKLREVVEVVKRYKKEPFLNTVLKGDDLIYIDGLDAALAALEVKR